MGKSVVLMANHMPGLEVSRMLLEMGDEIVHLYLVDPDTEQDRKIAEESGLPDERIFSATQVKQADHFKRLQQLEFDYIITVYWPYLLPPELFKMARFGTINFHPALLPINRGWYPHVHNILDGSPAGVTLHAIDEGIDSGPIWAQKEVSVFPWDNAKSLYDRLQKEILSLFRETWPKIKNGSITPTMQDHSLAKYHSKKEVDGLNEIDLDKCYRARDLIDLLRARTFGNLGFAFYEVDGQRVYLNLRLSSERRLDDGDMS